MEDIRDKMRVETQATMVREPDVTRRGGGPGQGHSGVVGWRTETDQGAG